MQKILFFNLKFKVTNLKMAMCPVTCQELLNFDTNVEISIQNGIEKDTCSNLVSRC